MNERRPKKDFFPDLLITGVVCVSLSLLFCLFFSISTSPLYSHYGYDSVVFQLIGKYWAQGGVPYITLWDHKGPYIFFINCLGYLLAGGKTGVFLIQIAHLSVAFFFSYLSFRQVFQSKWVAWISLVLTAVWLVCSYDEGNLTEEYLLPWISAVIFFTLQWAKTGRSEKRARAIALLGGIVLGISLMTRLTSASITCGILLYIGILFLKNKQWCDLLRIFLLFLLGFFIITAPFSIYFLQKNALDAAWFGTITANVSFAAGDGKWGFHLPSGIRLIIMAAPFFALVTTSIFLLLRKKRQSQSNSMLWVFATIPYFLWLLSSKCFTHYAMITIPLIPVLFALLHSVFETSSAKLYRVVMGLFVLVGIALAGISFRNSLKGFDYSSCKEAITMVQETIPNSDFDSFVAWEVHPAVYLETKVKPIYSHFFAQEWHASASNEMAQDIRDEFSSLRAKWILVSPKRAGRIQDILDQHYVRVASSAANNGTMPLFAIYQLKIDE